MKKRQTHWRIRAERILADLCGMTDSSAEKPYTHECAIENRVFLSCDSDGQGGGWKEEDGEEGSYRAARIWIYTKSVLCDGQGPTPENLRRKLSHRHGKCQLGLRGCLERPPVGNGTQCHSEGKRHSGGSE